MLYIFNICFNILNQKYKHMQLYSNAVRAVRLHTFLHLTLDYIEHFKMHQHNQKDQHKQKIVFAFISP